MRDSARGFPIVDFHCHFPVPDAAPSAAAEAYRVRHGDRKLAELNRNWRWCREQWWDAWSFPYREETEPAAEIQAGRWSAEIKAGQLEAVAFVTGGGNKTLASVSQFGLSVADRRLIFAGNAARILRLSAA